MAEYGKPFKINVGEEETLQTPFGTITIKRRTGDVSQSSSLILCMKNTDPGIGERTQSVNLRKGLGMILLFDLFSPSQGIPQIRHTQNGEFTITESATVKKK